MLFRSGERRPIDLGAWRWAMFGYAMFVAALSVFLPYIFLVQAAFAKAWGRGFSLDNLSFKNFHFVLFEHATAAKSVWNAFLFGGAAATLGVIITLGVAYIVAAPWLGYIVSIASLILATTYYQGGVLSTRVALVAVSGALFFWVLFVLVLGIPQPPGGTAVDLEQARDITRRIGFPVALPALGAVALPPTRKLLLSSTPM